MVGDATTAEMDLGGCKKSKGDVSSRERKRREGKEHKELDVLVYEFGREIPVDLAAPLRRRRVVNAARGRHERE